MYAMYLRKSRADIEAEALGEMETFARHQKILTELAKRQGLVVSKVYKEIVSGESIADRPEMQRLLEDVYQKKFKDVLVVEVERLARGDTRDQGVVLLVPLLSTTSVFSRRDTSGSDLTPDPLILRLWKANKNKPWDCSQGFSLRCRSCSPSL